MQRRGRETIVSDNVRQSDTRVRQFRQFRQPGLKCACASCYVHLAMCILLCASCCASYDLGIPSSPIRCPIGYPGRLSQRPSTSTSTTFASLIEHIRNGEEKKNLQLEHTKVKWQTLRADGNRRCRLHHARSASAVGLRAKRLEMGLRAKRLKTGLS